MFRPPVHVFTRLVRVFRPPVHVFTKLVHGFRPPVHVFTRLVRVFSQPVHVFRRLVRVFPGPLEPLEPLEPLLDDVERDVDLHNLARHLVGCGHELHRLTISQHRCLARNHQ